MELQAIWTGFSKEPSTIFMSPTAWNKFQLSCFTVELPACGLVVCLGFGFDLQTNTCVCWNSQEGEFSFKQNVLLLYPHSVFSASFPFWKD